MPVVDSGEKPNGCRISWIGVTVNLCAHPPSDPSKDGYVFTWVVFMFVVQLLVVLAGTSNMVAWVISLMGDTENVPLLENKAPLVAWFVVCMDDKLDIERTKDVAKGVMWDPCPFGNQAGIEKCLGLVWFRVHDPTSPSRTKGTKGTKGRVVSI